MSKDNLAKKRMADKQRMTRESIPYVGQGKSISYPKDALDAYNLQDWDLLKKLREKYAQKDTGFIHATLSKEGVYPKTERYNRDFLVKDEEKEYIDMLKTKCENLVLVQTKGDKKQNSFAFDATKISVVSGENLQSLEKKIVKLLPEREAIYDKDLYTDKPVKFLIAEKVRGYLLDNIDKEIPHGVAVVVSSFVELDEIAKLDIDIVCEREQHKGIVIGKGGSVLKKLGQEVRLYAEDLLQKKCLIKLFVKVDKDWRMKNIEQYGY